MKRTLVERAKLATRISRKEQDPAWQQFPQEWTAFKAIYSAIRNPRESEADGIDRAVLKFFDDAEAAASIADMPQAAIDKLLRLPPGDDKRSPSDPQYRAKTRAWAATFASNAGAAQRLSALVRVVYQVRCNMVHGQKDPDHWRDKSLVSACAPIAAVLVQHLTKIIGK
jgi:hypothetical protein